MMGFSVLLIYFINCIPRCVLAAGLFKTCKTVNVTKKILTAKSRKSIVICSGKLKPSSIWLGSYNIYVGTLFYFIFRH